MKQWKTIIMSVIICLTACFSSLAMTACAKRVEVYFETGTEETFEPVKRRVGDTYGKLPTPTREDYAFKGWYTEKMDGIAARRDVEVTKNYTHTLYAKWQYRGEKKEITFPLGVAEKRLDSAGGKFYIDNNNNLFAWGSNGIGILGDGTREDKYIPIQIMKGTKFSYIDTAGYYTYAIDENGGLWGWGQNIRGAAYLKPGRHTLTDEYTEEYYLSPVKIMENKKFYKAVTGDATTGFLSMAIDQQGRLWAWGEDYYGQLRQGKMVGGSSVPLQVMKGTRFIDVDTSGNHCAAIDENGTLYIWGTNTSGERGNGRSFSTHGNSEIWCPTPTKTMEGTRFTKVFLRASNTYAIDEDGNIWACGSNDWGQVGYGKKEDCLYLTQITHDLIFNHISSSSTYAVAIDEYGDLWFWGLDKLQLWDEASSETPQYTPIEILFEDKLNNIVVYPGIIYMENDKCEIWAWGYYLENAPVEKYNIDERIRIF